MSGRSSRRPEPFILSHTRAFEPCELALLDKKKFRFMIEEASNFVLGEFGSRLRATNPLL
jgi:hypothetical protein